MIIESTTLDYHNILKYVAFYACSIQKQSKQVFAQVYVSLLLVILIIKSITLEYHVY